MNITIPNEALLTKHGITLEEFTKFMVTGEIQYQINSRASLYCGASLCDRNHLASQEPPAQRMEREFVAKYGQSSSEFRKQLLDKMNDYAEEFYNRRALGSPNGRHFW